MTNVEGSMTWQPRSEADLAIDLANDVAAMRTEARVLWNLIRVEPVKWRLHPWGDQGGGFWVVGTIGRQVVWYNDIEDGFNISRYDVPGEIAEYWCNQDELGHIMESLLHQIETGRSPIKLGPPQPLPWAAGSGRDNSTMDPK